MTEVVEDTYVSWIDRQTDDDRKAYYARCEELRRMCPKMDSITLQSVAKRTPQEMEEIFGNMEPWDPSTFVFIPPKEKCVMTFNNRAELEAWEAEQASSK
tara:strand:+ start:159 stop:458 length:300 start_codon:yes stop_codon:yes gene_type:complete